MKKVLFTIMLSCAALFSSAQFTMVSTINAPADNEDWSVSNVTNNMGLGYNINSNTMVGLVKSGDDYNVFARHKVGFFGIHYLSLETPTENIADNAQIGLGWSICLYNNLYIEPNYPMPLNEDDNGNREGKFNVGLAYRFN